MSAGKLWSFPGQPYSLTIRAAAAYGDVELTQGEPYEHKVTNKTPEFVAKFPVGKVPALEATAGINLFESSAIAYYVSRLSKNGNLLGSTPESEAQVLQWQAFFQNEISQWTMGLMIMFNHHTPYNKPSEILYRERLATNLAILDGVLKTRTYLVGERITLADIAAATTLRSLFTQHVDAAGREKIPNVVRFFNTVVNHPKFKPIYGEITFAEKAVQYVPPAKPAKEKKEAAPAPPKEKAAPKPKEKDEEDDDDEPLVKEEPKPKNPLDSLPKSEFNLEDWKRAYSNMDTRGSNGSIEWFYNKFDKEGFSIWRCDFKYPEELTLVFMSSNLITGFFNRLEASRKYLFGSVGVLGENNNSLVSGVFICRGKDIKPVVDVAPDWESYNFKEVNLEDKADKEFFEAALAWDLEIDGKKWADGKAFK